MTRAEGIDKYPFRVTVLSEGGGKIPQQHHAFETIEAAMAGVNKHKGQRFVKFIQLYVRLETWDCQQR